MKNELAEAKAALSRIAAGTNHAGDIRAVRVVIERLEALFTPRADDVREALVSELRLWAALIGTEPRGARDLLTRAADALAEVRPRGTVTDDYEAGYGEGFHHGRSTPAVRPVTDAEVGRAARALFARSLPRLTWDEVGQHVHALFLDNARAALEAAREVPRGD